MNLLRLFRRNAVEEESSPETRLVVTILLLPLASFPFAIASEVRWDERAQDH